MGLLKLGHHSLSKTRFYPNDKYKPALYIYMLQRIQIPPTPMSAVAVTVNTTAGNPMLSPFGPSQSAGTVRATACGGTVTFAEARQAAEYAGMGFVCQRQLARADERTHHEGREQTQPSDRASSRSS